MKRPSFFVLLAAVTGLLIPFAASAQSSIAEDFTQASTTNPWYFFNGACLTAGTSTGVEPVSATGLMPGCTTIATSYYNKSSGEVLTGGYNGTFPDPVGKGALRFTNGYPYGYNESGGILSTTPFPTGQGVSITFKTVTYLGNSGGGGSDGADGISFFLMDASQLNTATINGKSNGDGNGLGSFGGSLGYTCSNNNSPYNGLTGGYLGLGIDEYGNFLNGTTNTLGETGTTASGDNTATGGGYQPGRIGLRGAGSISFNALTAAYGVNPNNAALPYYPASLLTSCGVNGGTYNATTGGCMSCSSGTYTPGTNTCATTTCTTGTYNATTGQCESCPSGDTYNSGANNCSTKTCSTGTYNATTGQCESCPSGDAYTSGTNTCLTQTCASGTYNASANKCETCTTGVYNLSANKCESCSTGTYNSTANLCEVCATGYTYNAISGLCTKGALTASPTTHGPTNGTPAASSPTSIAATGGPTNTISPTGSGTVSPTPSNSKPDWYSAVSNTCRYGTLYNYAVLGVPTSAGATSLTNSANTAGILDYGALPSGYTVLPTGTKIANETATTRAAAVPIYYQLKITQNGLLSLQYAVCPSTGCGSWQNVLTKQNITTANGPLPANFLFGFAGSTGGSSNIHEILCFRADPATSASSSAGASEKQSAKLETGVQAYFAYYNPSDGWTGRVTASSVMYDSFGNITVANVPNWDASCVLTGILAGTTCATTGMAGPLSAELPNTPGTSGSRQILTWNGSAGVALQYSNLTAAQQTALTLGDSSQGYPSSYTPADRLNYLRGDRTNEINSAAVGEFRRRSSILSDIVDSSPVWVGPPNQTYGLTWSDRINSSASLPENGSTVQTYPAYITAETNRQQVVYVGANDGMVHAFRSGTFNSSSGACATNPTQSCFTNNDGLEVLAYMPASVISGTSGQLIHPDVTNVANVPIDFSNVQYGHNYFVNAIPGSGDVFYGGQWHSWLVGGLGAGGAAIYALDVTNPANFTEGHAATVVLGEWSSSTITCVGNTGCGSSMGNTTGTPMIRRLHDGRWGVIFGNGYGSASGDAGIFVMTIDPTTGAQGAKFYYLSTGVGSAASPNGIGYVAPADLDGDHISDYVYAGDLKGNVWRFDITDPSETNWMVTPGPMFSTGGQPITTQLVVAAGSPAPGTQRQVMVLFGTGQKVGLTNASAATYAGGTQSLYGVWDWNLSASDGGRQGPGTGHPAGWDGLSGATYSALTRANAGLLTLTTANLQQQVVTINNSTQDREIATNASICWTGGCPSSTAIQFGWYFNLPGGGEQVIYSPELFSQAVTVNTIVPAINSPISCTTNTDTGFTYIVSALTGGAFASVFLPPGEQQFLNANPSINSAPYTDPVAIGIQTNATGSAMILTNASGVSYLINETNQASTSTTLANGTVVSQNINAQVIGANVPVNNHGKRLSWIELR
jgi:type IV pilus assembly protein PilY1